MGYSLLDNRYRFNGVVSTDKTVIQNLEALASAAGCWLTYDVGQGQWGIIINRPGDSVASFDNSNIIGSLTVSGTGITDLYNAVRVEFPHIDLSDQRDYVRLEIPAGRRNANEPDNTLAIQYDILNDPVQAELLATIELNQARVDRIVKFVTDYSNLGLKAGEIIDVTSDIYGFVNKKFRIITLVENDGDDGNITLEITALEYSDTVYDETQLNRYVRTASTGIPTRGNLGVPGTPEVSNFQSNARPHFVMTSTAPTGTVEGMEFWYTTDVPPAVTVDTNRAYQLLDTVSAQTGNTFAYGSTVSLDWDKFNAQNFLIKTRAVNSATTGPFSDPSGKIYYAPEQVTNTINENTQAKNSSTGLVTALGLLTLVNNLDNLFSGNTATGGLFSKVFDLFKTKNGLDLQAQASNIGNLANKSDSIPSFYTSTLTAATATVQTQFRAYAGNTAFGATNFAGDLTSKVQIAFTLPTTVKNLMFIVQSPVGQYSYQTKTSGNVYTQSNFYAFVPAYVDLFQANTLLQSSTIDWQTNNTIVQIANATPGTYTFKIAPLPTYDLDQETTNLIFPYNYVIDPQASGGGITITAYGFST